MRAQARESWRVEDGAGGAWREPRSETTNGALSPPPTSLRTPKASARMFPPSSSPSSPAIAALSRTSLRPAATRTPAPRWSQLPSPPQSLRAWPGSRLRRERSDSTTSRRAFRLASPPAAGHGWEGRCGALRACWEDSGSCDEAGECTLVQEKAARGKAAGATAREGQS